MRSSTETAVDPEAALPGRILSLWRTFRIGARAEPRLLTLSLGIALLMMLPDALLAVWLKLLVRLLAGLLMLSLVALCPLLGASYRKDWSPRFYKLLEKRRHLFKVY